MADAEEAKARGYAAIWGSGWLTDDVYVNARIWRAVTVALDTAFDGSAQAEEKPHPRYETVMQSTLSAITETLAGRASDIADDNVATAYLPADWEAMRLDLLNAKAHIEYIRDYLLPSVPAHVWSANA